LAAGNHASGFQYAQQNFDLSYVGEDNAEHRPVMLHRAILGTLERFIGIYIEQTDGRFPLWMCPTQVSILNVTDRQNDYCMELKDKMQSAGLRVHFDNRNEKLGYKIRENQLQKVPYMMIIGDKELEEKKVSVRVRTGETTEPMSIESFIEQVTQEIQTKSLESSIKV
jgi:threonyl-tRNA synthetase